MKDALFLEVANAAIEAQLKIVRRRMGYEIDDEDGNPVSPGMTKEPFTVVHHPTTSFSAVAIPLKVPLGTKYGEDWSRGKGREFEGESVKGRPSPYEVSEHLFASQKPLKTYQEMKDKGYFPEEV